MPRIGPTWATNRTVPWEDRYWERYEPDCNEKHDCGVFHASARKSTMFGAYMAKLIRDALNA